MFSLCAQRSTRTGRTVAAAHHLLRNYSNELASAQKQEQEQEQEGEDGRSSGDVVVALAIAKHKGVGSVRGDELARRVVLADIRVNSDTAVVRGRAKACVAIAVKDEDGDNLTSLELIIGEMCDEGDCLAVALRGYCHWFGIGVAQDIQQAIEWWQRAAALGNADAMFNLGVCFAKGVGVAQDKQQAIEWLQRAAGLANV